jgi:hypothetical protein
MLERKDLINVPSVLWPGSTLLAGLMYLLLTSTIRPEPDTTEPKPHIIVTHFKSSFCLCLDALSGLIPSHININIFALCMMHIMLSGSVFFSEGKRQRFRLKPSKS